MDTCNTTASDAQAVVFAKYVLGARKSFILPPLCSRVWDTQDSPDGAVRNSVGRVVSGIYVALFGPAGQERGEGKPGHDWGRRHKPPAGVLPRRLSQIEGPARVLSSGCQTSSKSLRA